MQAVIVDFWYAVLVAKMGTKALRTDGRWRLNYILGVYQLPGCGMWLSYGTWCEWTEDEWPKLQDNSHHPVNNFQGCLLGDQ